jgi:hypothetical protein
MHMHNNNHQISMFNTSLKNMFFQDSVLYVAELIDKFQGDDQKDILTLKLDSQALSY